MVGVGGVHPSESNRRKLTQWVSFLIVATLVPAGSGCSSVAPSGSLSHGHQSKVVADKIENAKRYFALLRTRPEEPPSSLRAELGIPHAIWSSAEQISLLTQQIWVIPTPTSVCLIEDKGNGEPSWACKQIKRVVREGMYVASIPVKVPGAVPVRTITGIVPDGTRTVRIGIEGERTRRVTVKQNVFSLRDQHAGVPKSLELVR